ncbi:MAG TPA: hypothetical protein VMS17_32520 [Gemmataceae bacterium]|nr:hypothetical protein [Gemmataceae bacterium]
MKYSHLLASALAALAVGGFASPLVAQAPFRPNPGGSMPGQPNNPNNPFQNNPFPNNPFQNNPGQFPNMPNPNPPNFPGLRFNHFNNDEWVCEGCGTVLSHGPLPPLGMRCPGCGAIIRGADFGNGMHLGPPNNPGGGNPGFNPGGAPPFGNPAPGNSAPAAPPPAPPPNPPPPGPFNNPNAQPGLPAMNAPPGANAPAPPVVGVDDSSTTSTPSSSLAPLNTVGAVVLGVVVAVTGLAVLGGAACLIIFSVARSSAPRRSRRRFVIDDD